MGRYSVPLAPVFADFAGVRQGQTALDVGCGPGALTAELVRRLGAAAVTAVDPSQQFVDAAKARHPDVDVRLAAAEELPFPSGTFDAALAQLVVHFMADPVAGLGEMRRVTVAGGVVAACVWDLAGGRSPSSPFWAAARELESDTRDESDRPGAKQGQLTDIFQSAGLTRVEEVDLSTSAVHSSFEDWWEPFTLGVGPAGNYAQRLGDDQLGRLRERCRQRLPEAPFTLTVHAWAARGLA